MENDLVLSRISYSIENKNILKEFSFTFSSKNSYLLIARSGYGKTTLCKIISRQILDHSGEVVLQGKPLKEISKKIFYLPQEVTLFDWLTVAEHLSLVSKDYKNSELLTLLELGERYNSFPYQLSGGEKQRLLLTIGILIDPEVLILDETLSSLETPFRNRIINFLITWTRENNKICIFVSHFLDDFINFDVTPINL